MKKRNAVLLTLGLFAPLALVDTPAGAIDQDLVASTNAGPPGTEVTLSSASCTASGEDEAFLDVRLYSGTEPNLKLAGIASSMDGVATITIPDWVDPDQPATFTAQCYLYDAQDGSDESLEYDPVAFDVEPGAGAPVQVPTFSRTQLLAGQGTLVSGAGCGSAERAMVIAVPGTDLSGRTEFEADGAYAFEAVDGGSFATELAMTNSYVEIEVSGDSQDDARFETTESPNTLAPGEYSVFTYCIEGESALVLEPSIIELTGAADTSNVDLSGLPGLPEDFTFGGSCAEDEVTGTLDGQSLDSILGDPLDAVRSAPGPRNIPGLPQQDGDAVRVRAGGQAPGNGQRLVRDGESTDFTAITEPSGQWYIEDAADFDAGFIMGWARCGDPLGDGYYYDGQARTFEPFADDPTTTVPQLVPPTVPAPAPADAVPGTPTYAG
jgi:hypothetical protein